MTTSLFDDLVKFVTATTGAGAITPGTAASGYRPASVLANGIYSYSISDGANYEVGRGTWNGTTLTRGPIKSSSSNAAITLSGLATVAITLLAEDLTELSVSNWAVFYGSYSGSSIAMASSSFTTVTNISAGIDNLSSFNATTGIYTIQQAGTYLMEAKFRVADNTANYSLGIGVATTNGDSASFFWGQQTSGVSGGFNRNGLLNLRPAVVCAVGDQYRLFYYADAGSPGNYQAAELSIVRIR